MRRIMMVLLLPLAAGCHTWRPTSMEPARAIQVEQPSAARVTLSNGEFLVLEQPWVRNDSISGSTAAGVRWIATAEIRSLEIRKLSTRRTLALVGLGVATYIVVGCSVDPDNCWR